MEINAVWIGPDLPLSEQLCAASWVHHGHRFRLWAYGDVANVPEGVEVCDATEVLGEPIQRYQDKRHPNSPVLHANLFRLEMLAEYGGAVVDADTLCISDRDLDTSRTIISSEGKQRHPNFAFINAPQPGADIWVWARDEAWKRLDERGPIWQSGQFGPGLIKDAVDKFNAWDSVVAPSVFCHIKWNATDQFWKAPPPKLPDEAIGIQLWGAALKKQGRDMSTDAHPNSLIGRWKDAYLGS